jgi:P-type conjugative transfer protein TrbL
MAKGLTHATRWLPTRATSSVVMGAVLTVPVHLSAQTDPGRATDLEVIFRSHQSEWLANAHGLLMGLATALLLLEIAYSSLEWQRKRMGADAIFGSLIWKIGAVTIMLLLFRYPHLTTERVIGSFERLGGMIAGDAGKALTSTEIVTQGGEIAQRLLDQLQVEQGMPLQPPEDQGLFTRFSQWVSGVYNSFGIGLVNAIFAYLYTAGITLLVALVVVIAYVIIALQLLLVKLESILVLSTAIVFLPFGGFRLTAGLADAYLKYAGELAVRFFFLQVIAGIGYDLFDTLYELSRGLVKYDPSRGPMHWVLNPPFLDLQVAIALVFASVAYAYLAWKIPGASSRRFAAELRIGVADGMRAH